MFSNFDFDVIVRSLPYLFYDGMTFTLTLTALATAGGVVWGTLLALMRLSGVPPLSKPMTGRHADIASTVTRPMASLREHISAASAAK